MKRFPVLIFTVLLGLALIADSAFGAPRPYSYRGEATAGMFLTEYDRLYDNPAYVGAKLNFLEYENSITKEKTNIFTMADGLNEDGRFVAGGIGDPGLGFIGGIGGLVELGISTTPYQCTYDTDPVGNTEIDFYDGPAWEQYYGNAEASEAYYTDNGGDGEFDEAEILQAKEEYYNDDRHLNARIAAGGIKAGDLTFGLSFERNTDDLEGDDTGETVRKGGYSYTDTDIIQDLLLASESRSFNQSRSVLPVNYMLVIGSIIPIGGFIETVEAALIVNYLQKEIKEDNSESRVVNNPGVQTSTYYGNSLDGDAIVSDSEKQDGFQYGIAVRTREKLLGFDTTTSITWVAGGLTPNKERTTVFQAYNVAANYNYYYPGNPDQVDRLSTTGRYEYSGDGIVSNAIIAGIMMRKNITKDLLGGIGFTYQLLLSENKYTRRTIYRESEVVNNGNGIDDGADYTRDTTGSYTDDFTDTMTGQQFIVPIGFEYQATPTLCWRIGVIHTTTIVKTSSKWERGGINEEYDNYDYADVPGDENDNDGPAGTTSGTETIGSFDYDTTERSHIEKRTFNTQSNDYYFGIGYSVEKCVQIDVLLSGTGNTFEIDAGQIAMSATYVVQ